MQIEEITATPGINPNLKKQLSELKLMSFVDAVLISNDLAVVAGGWSDYSGGGGVARYSIIYVLHKNAIQHKHWQYADKWSSRNDRRDRMIVGLGEIKVTEEGNQFHLVIECRAPKGYQMFDENISITMGEDSEEQLLALPCDEQREFRIWVEEKKSEIFQDLMATWSKNTHTVPSAHGRLPYEQPRITQLQIDQEAGLAILIHQEQIDFKGVDNPQRQQRALLLQWEGKKVSLLTQKNAYQQSGSPEIQIISFTREKVIFGTEDGYNTISMAKV